MKKRIFSIMAASNKKKAGIIVFCILLITTFGAGFVFTMSDNGDQAPPYEFPGPIPPADPYMPIAIEIGNIDIRANPVLTIALSGNQYQFIHSAAQIFERMHEGVTINIERHGEFRMSYDAWLRTALDEGNAPDIFAINPGIEFYLAKSPMLVNLYELMDNDPNFHMEDYFTEVFKALEVNGRLPYIPVCFLIDFIGLSDNAPIEARRMFLAAETMSYAGMVNIYNSIPDRYGLRMTTTGLSFMNIIYQGCFIDYRRRVSLFNEPEFIDFLYNVREMRQNESYFPETVIRSSRDIPKYYMFRRYLYPGSIYRVLLPASVRDDFWGEFGFSEFRPYADAHGNINLSLLMEPSLAINAYSDNIGLAWEFMKFLLSEELFEILFTVSGRDGSFIPTLNARAFVNRNLNAQAMEVFFTRLIVNEMGVELTDEIKYEIADAVFEFERLADMPMAHRWVWPPHDFGVLMNEILTDFEKGWLEPAQTADMLHRAALEAFEER